MTDDLKLGWLSPEGELVECRHFDHLSVARDILDSIHVSCDHSDDKLLELG